MYSAFSLCRQSAVISLLLLCATRCTPSPPQPGCWLSSTIHPIQKFPPHEASQYKASFPLTSFSVWLRGKSLDRKQLVHQDASLIDALPAEVTAPKICFPCIINCISFLCYFISLSWLKNNLKNGSVRGRGHGSREKKRHRTNKEVNDKQHRLEYNACVVSLTKKIVCAA